MVLCDGSHVHVPIAGSYTKASATYVDALADRLALVLSVGIRRHRQIVDFFDAGKAKGLESQVVNSLALCCQWKEEESWTFKKSSHINILELSVLGRLAKRLGSQGKSLRAVSLADSFVVSAATSKGRTSSAGLSPVLRRYNAVCVACGLYFNVPFVPTRLNPPDDLTRDATLRKPAGSFDVCDWPLEKLYDLAELPKLRRWISNWSRLVLSLMGPAFLELSDRALFRRSHLGIWTLPDAAIPSSLSFDATLGYPGEGPFHCYRPVTFLFCLLVHVVPSCPSCYAAFSLAMVSTSDAMVPRNTAVDRRNDLAGLNCKWDVQFFLQPT